MKAAPFFLTLVASVKPLTPGHLAGIGRYLDSQGLAGAGDPVWLAPCRAADIPLPQRPDRRQLDAIREGLHADRIDCFTGAAEGRRKKLLVADMDSTIVTGETLDDLADHAGLKDKISGITARAMSGELDFHAALTERVALLKDLPCTALDDVLAHISLTPGAEMLIRTMSAHGTLCVLASGGFTVFTAAVAKQAGFHHHHGNELDIENNCLTGRVKKPVLDKDAKEKILRDYAAHLQIPLTQTLALGDGANDLPMLTTAGLGIGYHPKSVIKDALDNCILYGDLTAALFAQGYRADEFIT